VHVTVEVDRRTVTYNCTNCHAELVLTEPAPSTMGTAFVRAHQSCRPTSEMLPTAPYLFVTH
jgi:hypothetical protein